MHHLSCLRARKNYKNENIHFYVLEFDKNMTSHAMDHFLHFHYIMRLTPFDFLQVKWLNSHILMTYVDART